MLFRPSFTNSQFDVWFSYKLLLVKAAVGMFDVLIVFFVGSNSFVRMSIGAVGRTRKGLFHRLSRVLLSGNHDHLSNYDKKLFDRRYLLQP